MHRSELIDSIRGTSMAAEFHIQHQERWPAALGGAALVVWGVSKMVTEQRRAAALLTSAGAGLIWSAAWPRSRGKHTGAIGRIVEVAVAINRSPEDLYAFWRDVRNLPDVIPELASVAVLAGGDDRRSHWIARGPARSRPEWDADIINDVPNRLIAWRTTEQSDVVSAGSVHFDSAPAARGTVVRIKLQYDPPGGRLGSAVAWAFGGSPAEVIREGLRRFKQLMETGEIATTDGQPRGAR
jgi:uncharacterized membrane protein